MAEPTVYDYPGYLVTQSADQNEQGETTWSYSMFISADKVNIKASGNKALTAFLRLMATTFDSRGYIDIGIFERHLDAKKDYPLIGDMKDAKGCNAKSKL